MKIACLIVTCLLAAAIDASAAGTQVKTDSFDSAGVKIVYLSAGQGDPVLLVHGLYSSAEMNWGLPGIIKQLADKHEVIALDLRGHGKSDKPQDDASYGEPMVDDLVRLMDHLQIKKAQIVGYSLGGMIVMKFAVEHPDRVQSVTLGGMGWLRSDSPLANSWESLGRATNGRENATPPAVAHGVAKLGVTEAELKAVKLPVEILVGDRDPVDKLYVQPLQSVRPDWPVTHVKDAGHLNCVTKEQFKDELSKWLNQNAK